MSSPHSQDFENKEFALPLAALSFLLFCFCCCCSFSSRVAATIALDASLLNFDFYLVLLVLSVLSLRCSPAAEFLLFLLQHLCLLLLTAHVVFVLSML